jgi:class 3 adenylate cyclase
MPAPTSDSAPAAPAQPAPPVPDPEDETPPPLPADPAPAAEAPAPRPPEDEVRPVTALFADIVGSTGLGERLAAHEVKALIGECVSRMTRAVEQFGGVVQAYMGDGIAAFFGAPSAHEDDPERAGRAALRIIEELGVYAKEVESVWGISGFNARVGINTGEAAVGLVGGNAPQSVSLGDMANVAARLQAAADPGAVVVGEGTAKALLHKFALEPLGEVSVKGRRARVPAWKLVGAHTALRAAPHTPLVGRDAEVARLGGVLDELAAGRGQIVILLGDSGIGKTRVLGELRVLAAERVAWLEGHCLSYGTGLPYAPFVEMLRAWIGAEEGEPEIALRTKLRVKLMLLPEPQAAELLPYLARMLSIRADPADEERLGALPPSVLAEEVRKAFLGWVESLAEQGPVVVAIEDLHWGDACTCKLTAGLLELAERAPLLLVTTLRVDTSCEGWRLRVHALSDHPHRALELPLEPLSDDSARRLLAGLPEASSLQEADVDLIVTGAEGNPLYLEELLHAFADGSRFRAGFTSASTATGARMLTPTLESLLLARIDRLPETARRLV